jgi:hypothetical protein
MVRCVWHWLLRLNFDAFRVLLSELRPTAVDGKFGAGREGRIEREEEDGLGELSPVKGGGQLSPRALDTASARTSSTALRCGLTERQQTLDFHQLRATTWLATLCPHYVLAPTSSAPQWGVWGATGAIAPRPARPLRRKPAAESDVQHLVLARTPARARPGTTGDIQLRHEPRD